MVLKHGDTKAQRHGVIRPFKPNCFFFINQAIHEKSGRFFTLVSNRMSYNGKAVIYFVIIPAKKRGFGVKIYIE